jgi:2,4-dienoyl-CoA reductase-like NADH-dependent reductase (Old Yellow Enzyme family)
MASALFTPIHLRGLTLANRIVVSPMCQYSADDGSATQWHMQHLGSLVHGGVGLVVIEATGVDREGRITHGCLGLYSDENEAALARVVEGCRRFSPTPIGIQLAHAGRKASSARPWEGGGALTPDRQPWTTVAPSAVAFAPGWHTPQALTPAALDRIVQSFVAATRRAQRLGLDLVELHCAHGYLMHEFLSPIANRRDDEYGGSIANRMRLPLKVFAAMRAAWPAQKPMGVRLSSTDWVEGGWTIEDAVIFARALKECGCDFVCASGGGIAGGVRVPTEPGYMVGFAERIRREVQIATRAVGLIVTPRQAEAIVEGGQADMVALARAVLDDPRWGWHAADALGTSAPSPPQYERARAKLWPGAALVRPG